MVWRLILGPVLIAVLAGLFYLDAHAGRTAPVLLVLTLALAARGTWELVELLRIRAFQPQLGLVMACNLVIVFANWWPRFVYFDHDIDARSVAALGPAMLTFSLSVLVLLWSEAWRYREPGHSLESLGAELLVVSYIGVLLSVTAQLRWVAGSDAGYLALGSLLVTVKCGDIGAYFFGRFWGRRKLIERLSPGKTRMGARGALVGASLGAMIWFEWISQLFNENWPRCTWYWALFFGISLGAVGLMGDLCESLIKRDSGKKDSAALFPGFGGLLDLIDSVIYAAPVGYFLWLFLPHGPG